MFPQKVLGRRTAVAFLTVCGLAMHNLTSLAADTQSAASPQGSPIVAVDAAEHDFGPVVPGTKVNHAFKVTNKGKVELAITKVKPNCGCTVAGDYPKSIAPNETGEFPFVLTVPKIVGPFKRDIIINTNDPAMPELKVTLKGTGQPLVLVTPPTVSLGAVYGVKPTTKVVSITSKADKPLKMVLDPLSSAKGWTFELTEKKPGEQYELAATFNPTEASPGTNSQSAVLLTNIETEHEVKVAAVATLHERIEAEPATLTINAPSTQPVAAQASPVTRTIRFQNYGDKPVKALEVSSEDTSLTASLKEQKPGRSYLIDVTVPPTYTVGKAPAILVKTDDTEKPVVRIPVVVNKPSTPKPQKPHPAEQLVGKPSPTFKLKTLDGKDVTPDSFKGAVTILNFFAPNCGFCKKQVPRVDALRSTYEPKGVRFLNVGETMGKVPTTKEMIAEKFKELGVTGEAALDPDNAVGHTFFVSSYPTMFILGKSGKIEFFNRGNMQDLETRIQGQLDSLLGG